MNGMLSTSDLQVMDGEPRILDLRIAERLGMGNPHSIRETIESNRDELERYGEVSRQCRETSSKGGRPGTEYWLNESQTLLLCMFSRTEAAADVRQEVISVYMAYRQGGQPKTTAARMPKVSMSFEDYSEMTRALTAGALAMEQVNKLQRDSIRREDRVGIVQLLIENTSLSDEDIAEKMQDMLGAYMPEWVAYFRRKTMPVN